MNKSVWKQSSIHMVGGLLQIGYAENSDLLLVLSHTGRGIFDCLTGQKIARNPAFFDDSFNESTLMLKGFDALNGQTIKTAGLFGGALPAKMRDGWRLALLDENKIYLFSENIDEKLLVGDNETSELRAFGFSETGGSFVIATAADIIIFLRQVI